ncbi:MAG: hypothetical protein GY832_11685 [Chloroflexi bacterium]|nr:hypothetical protein [Chloroflexota bacterium]
MNNSWDINLVGVQSEFFQSTSRYPAFVGGWGSGKTMMGILKAMDLSYRYPNNKGVIFRKNYTDLRDSTMSDFTLYTGKKVPSSKTVRLENGSEILFHHLDELAGVAQNINLGWFMIEQAEEFDSEVVFNTLRGRLRRVGSEVKQGYIIANTNGHNWIWRLWKQDLLEDAELFEMTPFDNPHLPDDFVADLRRMEIESPSHFRRFCMNSWEDTDTADKVIPYQSLLDSVGRDLREYGSSLKVISCDPAEYGDDKTVIYVLDGLEVIDCLVTSKKSLMETAGRIVSLHRQYNSDAIIIDDIGVGAGVRASVRETLDPNQDKGLVIGFNSGRAAGDKAHYVRMRDEVWGHAAKLFKDEYVSLLKDDDLVEDLAAHTYSLNSKGQMLVARKKDIKKALGRSPDRADALVMGLWAAKKAVKREVVFSGAREEEYNPLTFGI